MVVSVVLCRVNMKNVQHIRAATGPFAGAFAAILRDGSIVTWGKL